MGAIAKRARRLPAGFAALAALSALLVVPALHGTLDHVHDPCGGAAALACHLAASDARLAAGAGGDVCPLCLASSQARSLLSPTSALTGRCQASTRAPALPAAGYTPSPLSRSLCAPRAPPVPA